MHFNRYYYSKRTKSTIKLQSRFLRYYMSVPNTEEVKTSTRDDETRRPGNHELVDVVNATNSSGAPITSEEAARQIKAAGDPLSKQLDKLCDLVKEPKKDYQRRSEKPVAWLKVPHDRMATGLTAENSIGSLKVFTYWWRKWRQFSRKVPN